VPIRAFAPAFFIVPWLLRHRSHHREHGKQRFGMAALLSDTRCRVAVCIKVLNELLCARTGGRAREARNDYVARFCTGVHCSATACLILIDCHWAHLEAVEAARRYQRIDTMSEKHATPSSHSCTTK